MQEVQDEPFLATVGQPDEKPTASFRPGGHAVEACPHPLNGPSARIHHLPRDPKLGDRGRDEDSLGDRSGPVLDTDS
jgi:hypothetical protein